MKPPETLKYTVTVIFLLIKFEMDAKELTCDFVKKYFTRTDYEIGCAFNGSTVIDSDNYEISNAKNETVLSMSLENNKNVAFLPIRVFRSFPNLKIYSATSCSISKISKEHFGGLFNLSEISLMDNQIVVINSDTFQELPLLYKLNLRETRVDLTAEGKQLLWAFYRLQQNCSPQLPNIQQVIEAI